MSYQVLARKWRPRRFEDMVGQTHVLRALTTALDSSRLHHAYLFTGTRGVGKTTVARIFAKALNCERGVSAQPCGECSACRELDEGRFVDLIEVDAASRTGVDDTLALLDNVPYAPTRGRYKVYLIDEVHMFSRSSFNALLKTLEEPPPHVKFLFATTEPRKLPVTVLSRCLQFNLKRIPTEQISARIAHILEVEGVVSERAGRDLIAEAAEGSLRDALSLLDQAIAFGGGALQGDSVREMLGTIDRGQVVQLLEALADADGAALLVQVDRLANLAVDFADLLTELLRLLQRVAVMQVVPAVADSSVEEPRLRALATRMSPEECQLCYQIAVLGRRDLELAPDPRGGFEMTLLRMLAFRPTHGADESPKAQPGRARATATSPGTAAGTAAAASTAERAPAGESAGSAAVSEWTALIDTLKLSGLVREFASHCVLAERSAERLHLVLDTRFENLRTAPVETRLRQAVSEHLGPEVKLLLSVGDGGETPADERQRARRRREDAAAAGMREDAFVRALQDTLGASIESTRPREG